MLPERGLLSGVIITAWSLGPNTQMLSLPAQTSGLLGASSYAELPYHTPYQTWQAKQTK